MMDDFLQFLREPIAQRSLLACVMIGFANGFVSGLVILKKSALQIGTLSCALLPGIAVAVLLFGLTRWSLLTGAVVAALLVGKTSRANELGIRLTLDRESVLSAGTSWLSPDAWVTILGNLIENAIEGPAVGPRKSPSASVRGRITCFSAWRTPAPASPPPCGAPSSSAEPPPRAAAGGLGWRWYGR